MYYYPDHLYWNNSDENKINIFFHLLFLLSLPSALFLELLVKIHGRSWEATCQPFLKGAADFLSKEIFFFKAESA